MSFRMHWKSVSVLGYPKRVIVIDDELEAPVVADGNISPPSGRSSIAILSPEISVGSHSLVILFSGEYTFSISSKMAKSPGVSRKLIAVPFLPKRPMPIQSKISQYIVYHGDGDKCMT